MPQGVVCIPGGVTPGKISKMATSAKTQHGKLLHEQPVGGMAGLELQHLCSLLAKLGGCGSLVHGCCGVKENPDKLDTFPRLQQWRNPCLHWPLLAGNSGW
jgi:hypothetical protein